jgi:hypothetical protein
MGIENSFLLSSFRFFEGCIAFREMIADLPFLIFIKKPKKQPNFIKTEKMTATSRQI